MCLHGVVRASTREYARADDEFKLIEALARARTAAKLTQAERARRLGSPLDYSAGDLSFAYTFQPHPDRVKLALTWERVCSLLRQAEDS